VSYFRGEFFADIPGNLGGAGLVLGPAGNHSNTS